MIRVKKISRNYSLNIFQCFQTNFGYQAPEEAYNSTSLWHQSFAIPANGAWDKRNRAVVQCPSSIWFTTKIDGMTVVFFNPLKRQSQQLSSALSSACEFKSHFCKQCGPRSDCSSRSRLIWVHPVCLHAKSMFEKFTRRCSRRQTDDIFRCRFSWRFKG